MFCLIMVGSGFLIFYETYISSKSHQQCMYMYIMLHVRLHVHMYVHYVGIMLLTSFEIIIIIITVLCPSIMYRYMYCTFTH